METKYTKESATALAIEEVIPQEIIPEKILPKKVWTRDFVESQIKAITEQADGWILEATKRANDYKQSELPKLEKALLEMNKQGIITQAELKATAPLQEEIIVK